MFENQSKSLILLHLLSQTRTSNQPIFFKSRLTTFDSFWLIFKVCDIMISKIIVSLSFHFIILLFLMHRVMILKPEEEEC